MIHRTSILAIMASVCVWAGPAQAQSTDPDVRCLTVSKFFAKFDQDPRKRQMSVASAFFYLGRIDAKLSTDQLKAQIATPGAAIKKTEASQLMMVCARKIQSVQQSLMNMGRATTTLPLKK